MDSWMWYLSRSTGIVAAILAVAALLLGFLFSARNTGNRKRPSWWLALHNWLGGLTLTFIALHMFVSLLDTGAGLRLIDLFVPSAQIGWAIGWGVIAAWLSVVVVLPSMGRIRQQLPRQVWHLLHLLAVPAAVLTAVHAYMAGTEALTTTFARALALLVGVAVFSLSVRVAGLIVRRRATA